jgi:hypothetical protein
MQPLLITAELLISVLSLYFFHRCNNKHVNWAAALLILALLTHAASQIKQIGAH